MGYSLWDCKESDTTERPLSFPSGTGGKEPGCQCRYIRDMGSIPGSRRSPGGGHGNPFQYSCLENSMDRGQFSPENSMEVGSTGPQGVRQD